MNTNHKTDRRAARITNLEALCAAAYQLAGAVGAPEVWLDVLWAAAEGRAFSVDGLLPVVADDCDAVAELRAQLEGVRRIVAVGPAAAELGRIGGQRRSVAKRRAARANGLRGGRPPAQTPSAR